MGELINGRTPEEIKETLKRCHMRVASCKGCAYWECRECENKHALDALAYIEALEMYTVLHRIASDVLIEGKPKWISVEDRLPEEKESVLVHYTDGWMPIAFLLDGKWHQSGGETSWLSVTHWMPLPEPPKEDA